MHFLQFLVIAAKRTLTAPFFLGLLLLLRAGAGTAKSAQGNADNPVVKSAEMPLYPPLARQARIEGTVAVQVTTDGNSIVRMAASGAHKLLMDAAQENLRTWRFYRHKPQTFTVTYVYKLETPEVHGLINPMIILDLPNHVEIRAKMQAVEWTTTGTPD